MPRRRGPVDNRALVRYISGAEKYVQRSRLSQLGPNWSRVPTRKTSAKSDNQPSASLTASDPAEPGTEKENADGLQSDTPRRRRR